MGLVSLLDIHTNRDIQNMLECNSVFLDRQEYIFVNFTQHVNRYAQSVALCRAYLAKRKYAGRRPKIFPLLLVVGAIANQKLGSIHSKLSNLVRAEGLKKLQISRRNERHHVTTTTFIHNGKKRVTETFCERRHSTRLFKNECRNQSNINPFRLIRINKTIQRQDQSKSPKH